MTASHKFSDHLSRFIPSFEVVYSVNEKASINKLRNKQSKMCAYFPNLFTLDGNNRHFTWSLHVILHTKVTGFVILKLNWLQCLPLSLLFAYVSRLPGKSPVAKPRQEFPGESVVITLRVQQARSIRNHAHATIIDHRQLWHHWRLSKASKVKFMQPYFGPIKISKSIPPSSCEVRELYGKLR
jgi:hypothetical protein